MLATITLELLERNNNFTGGITVARSSVCDQ